MSENQQSSGEVVERNPDGTFREGHIKVGGAVKGARHFTTIVQEALVKLGTTATGEKVEVQKALGEKVVKMALDGNEQMIKLIWNYLDGLPKASLELEDSRTDETKEKLKQFLDKMNELK